MDFEKLFRDLDAQEAELEVKFKAAIHAYFEGKAAVKAGRQTINYIRQLKVEEDGEKPS